jgi:hypothetical protein
MENTSKYKQCPLYDGFGKRAGGSELHPLVWSYVPQNSLFC